MKVTDYYPVQGHIGGMPLSKSLALILGSWLIGYPIAAFMFISDSAVHWSEKHPVMALLYEYTRNSAGRGCLVVALIPARPSAARSAIFAFVAVVLLAASIRPKGNPQAIAMSLIKMGPVSANGSMDARPHVKSHASYAFTSPTLVSLSGEKARRSGFLHTLLAYYREMRMLLHGALPAERSGGKIATVLCMSNSHKAHCKGSSRSNFDDPTNHVRVRQRCGEG